MKVEVLHLFESAKKAADAANVESPNKADVCRCVDSLKQLKSIPVNSDLLVSTQVGKRLRSLTKHPAKAIEAMANELLDIWKKLVLEEATKKRTCASESKSQLSRPTTSDTENKKDVSPSTKCNGDLRKKTREHLAEALSRVKKETPENLLEKVKEHDPDQIAMKVEKTMFDKLGLSNGSQKLKYRSIMFNMKDQKNPDLRRKVLLGEVRPEQLVSMTAEEMASDKRQMENKQIKEKALFDCELGGPPKATTDQFRCARCGHWKTTYYQLQTRSADEPMTTYVTCVNCNNRWKFC